MVEDDMVTHAASSRVKERRRKRRPDRASRSDNLPPSRSELRSARAVEFGASQTDVDLAFEMEFEEIVHWSTRLTRWLKGLAATGYGVSVLVHLLVLVILSLVVISTRTPEEPAITSIFTNYDATSLDDVEYVTLDTIESTQPPNPAEMLAASSPAVDLISSMLQPEGEGEEGSVGLAAGFQMPGGGRAVTKGSFTAWTVPEDPAPREDYLVVIQVRVPEKIRTYRKEDLSGFLEGDDGYETPLGNFTGKGFPKQFYGRYDDKARQFVIRIPGGAAKVHDTIRIRSKILREEQTLEITF